MKWPIESKQYSLIQRSHRELSRDPHGLKLNLPRHAWSEGGVLYADNHTVGTVVNRTSRHVKKSITYRVIQLVDYKTGTEQKKTLDHVLFVPTGCGVTVCSPNTTQQITPRRV